MQAPECFCRQIFPTALTQGLESVSTHLMTYISPSRSESASNLFIFNMKGFIGDFDAPHAKEKAESDTFLCYKLVSAPEP